MFVCTRKEDQRLCNTERVIDIFSCKKFDSYKSEKQAKDFFNIVQIKTVTLERGIDFEDPEEMMKDMESNRINLTTQTISVLAEHEDSNREVYD